MTINKFPIPRCPICGKSMNLKEVDNPYWICRDLPQCTGIRDIDVKTGKPVEDEWGDREGLI